VFPRTVPRAFVLATSLTLDGPRQACLLTSSCFGVSVQLREELAEEGAEFFVAGGEDSEGAAVFSAVKLLGGTGGNALV